MTAPHQGCDTPDVTALRIVKPEDIPQDAPLDEYYRQYVEGVFRGLWKVCRNWCGVVYASEARIDGQIREDGDEIVLRKDWGNCEDAAVK